MIVNKNILFTSILKKNMDNMVSDMDGEIVILSLKNGKYYNLGAMGSEIWNLIEQSMTTTEIINHLVGEYDISLEDCRDQVGIYLEQLLTEELILMQE